MKKTVLFIFMMLLITSCTKDPKIDYALFSGKIENVKSDKLTIRQGMNEVKVVQVNEDGSFNDTLKVTSGYYTAVHGREWADFFISPGNSLKLTLNTEQFDESINYEGDGAANNNYLARKYLLNEELSGDAEALYGLEEKDFLEKLNSNNNSIEELFKNSNGLDDNFIAMEEKSLNFEQLSERLRYINSHWYYAKKEKTIVSDSFTKPLESIDYMNSEDYQTMPSYKNLVLSYYLYAIEKSSDPAEIFENIINNGDNLLKEDLSNRLSYQIGPNNLNLKAYYDGIMAMSNDNELKSDLTTKYEKAKKLVKGMPSPKFENYENHKGGTVSLDDLKGKYVYVDVWATWCGPCIKEIPSLKIIEDKYHDKNIEFVSVSIDKGSDYEKWRTMVNEEELGGLQLFVDKEFKGGRFSTINSSFITDYNIWGIPRFILIDPEGKIVSADAPRPSNPGLVKLFDEIGI